MVEPGGAKGQIPHLAWGDLHGENRGEVGRKHAKRVADARAGEVAEIYLDVALLSLNPRWVCGDVRSNASGGRAWRASPIWVGQWRRMVEMKCPAACPFCGSAFAVRPKLVLVDEAWRPAPEKDCRLFYFADIRVDDLREEFVPAPPLEQFIHALFCDGCHKAFVSEEVLQGTRWPLRWT